MRQAAKPRRSSALACTIASTRRKQRCNRASASSCRCRALSSPLFLLRCLDALPLPVSSSDRGVVAGPLVSAAPTLPPLLGLQLGHSLAHSSSLSPSNGTAGSNATSPLPNLQGSSALSMITLPTLGIIKCQASCSKRLTPGVSASAPQLLL